ncbi:hypothetical protein D3C77_604880 [compost metagenome]
MSVEMPISAPRPYSKPSAKRVEALTITEAESTSVRKRRASLKFSVTIESVWCEPYWLMCSMACSSESTTRIARIGALYSANQSSSLASSTSAPSSARVAGQPRSSTPLAR